MDASEAVDTYLIETFRIGLEQVLAEATAGRMPIFLPDAVQIRATPLDVDIDDDGGIAESFEGTFSLNGLAYSFVCSVFTDRIGERFVSDIAEFEPAEWSARVSMLPARSRRA